MAELFGSILLEATGRAWFNLPGPPLISENRGGVYRRFMDVAVGPTGRVCGRVHFSLGHCHEEDLVVGASRRRADGPFPKSGLPSAVWVYGFHDPNFQAVLLGPGGIRLTARSLRNQNRPGHRQGGTGRG